MSTKVTIELPTAIHIRNREGVDAKPIKLETSKLSPEIVARIFEGGVKVLLTNVYNSGGKAVEAPAREAQLLKKLDAWYRGEYVQIERGESQYTAMREQYIDERKEAAGMSRAEVEKAIKATVASVFGEKESATFSRFLDAVAQTKYGSMDADGMLAFMAEHYPDAEELSVGMVRDVIEKGLAERTEAAAKARAEVAKALKVTGIDLGL